LEGSSGGVEVLDKEVVEKALGMVVKEMLMTFCQVSHLRFLQLCIQKLIAHPAAGL